MTGYMRPEAPTTVVVWQVCVDASAQGEGLAGRMLAAAGSRGGQNRGEGSALGSLGDWIGGND